MNKAVAHILRTALEDLPLLEKKAGLVQVAEYPDTVYDETGTKPTTTVKRIPVACDNNNGKHVDDLVPDGKKKGLLYFEDLGAACLGKNGCAWKWKSRLRLIAWYDARAFSSFACTQIQMMLVGLILLKLDALTNTSANGLTKLVITVDGMPKASRDLFAAYTYDLFNTQYLMAPYDFFALDLSVEYSLQPDCLPKLS